jgi:hypothetical protein
MELSEEALSGGMSLEQFKKSWQEFAGSDYTLGTWNEITHRLFRALLADDCPAIQLKRVYCSLSGGKCGPLHTVVEKHGLATPDLAMAMRAGLRLSNACAITSYLRELGLERLTEIEN